jgi:CheY-like chemotaxis protein
MADPGAPLSGRKILLVEDEYFVAQDMVRALEESGAEIVGPVANVEEALGLVRDTSSLSGAVLDVNLQGEMVYPVADALKARGIPFVFATGYDVTHTPPEHRDVFRCEKPVDPLQIVAALAG